MKIINYKYCSFLFVIFLSLSLMVSCTKDGFKGASYAVDLTKDNNNDDEEEDTEKESFDTDKDGEISEEEYDAITDKLGAVSLSVKRVESDCLDGKCDVTATFSLYSIDGTKVSSKVKEKSKTVVSFDKNGSTGDNSHLCPLVKKNVVLNMSLSYGGTTIESSDRSILVGGRESKKAIWVGVADKDDGYNFHNIDTIITEIKCPKVKKLKIRHLCEDSNLDDDTLRRCWTIQGSNSSCPSNNVYSNSQYSVSCK